MSGCQYRYTPCNKRNRASKGKLSSYIHWRWNISLRIVYRYQYDWGSYCEYRLCVSLYRNPHPHAPYCRRQYKPIFNQEYRRCNHYRNYLSTNHRRKHFGDSVYTIRLSYYRIRWCELEYYLISPYGIHSPNSQRSHLYNK